MIFNITDYVSQLYKCMLLLVGNSLHVLK